MSGLFSLDDLDDLPPDDVLAAVRQYIENHQVLTSEVDLFGGRPGTGQVPFLELTEVPVDQLDHENGGYRSDLVLLLLAPKNKDLDEFATDLMQQIRAGRCRISGLGNGRFIVLGNGQQELALLTRGRGVRWRPEDFLDHRAGLELRDADGPPFSVRIFGEIDRPLPGRSPEHQLELLCEAIETRGGPADQTYVLIDVEPWSITGAGIGLSLPMIERLARNRVSLSITALPFTGRRKAMLVNREGNHLLIPEREEVMFYETLRRQARWLRSRGKAPEGVPSRWAWLVETNLGLFLVDGDEEPRAIGLWRLA